jgi:hypothetical protein
MRVLSISLWVGVFSMVLGVRAARAQQEPESQGTPLSPELYVPRAPIAGEGNTEGENVTSLAFAADPSPLTGAQTFSPGGLPVTRSFWQPLLNLTSMADSNSLATNQPTGLTTWTYLYGGIDLHRISGRSDLTVNYLAGGLISNDGITGNALIQRLELGERLRGRRLTVSFFDQLTYLPETAFGFVAPTGPSPVSGQAVLLQPLLTADQSIVTSRGQRINNSVVAEEDRIFTPRSSLTLVQSYSLLRLPANGLLNVSDTIGQAGYNYQLTREDTVAVLYRFTAFRFGRFNQSINDHVVQFSYGRRITGRLALQVAAGPGIGFLRQPLSTGTGYTGDLAKSTRSSTLVYWTLDTTMTYRTERAQLGLAYDHSLSGGAGVLPGAVNDQFSGSINKQLFRTINGGYVMGYARNRGLNVAAPTPSNQTYNYVFGGVNIAHPWGRSKNIFLTYEVQFEDSNAAFCAGTTCGNGFVRHMVSFGLDWRPSPVR